VDGAERIRSQQAAWASQAGYPVDARGYLPTLEANLLASLHPETRGNISRGDGDELLDRHDRPAKMRALHSSSALACNFFDFWRHRDKIPLVAALGLAEPAVDISFEVRLPTGVRGKSPNLDVLLTLASGRAVAIECKFTEPYSHHSDEPPFKPAYFPAGRARWTAAGLPNCQRSATELARGEAAFELLNAGQLLKHALGVATTLGTTAQLLYLYYDATGNEAARHRDEVSRFTAMLHGELWFRGVSYQEVFERMRLDGAAHKRYAQYLADRYFRVPVRPDAPSAPWLYTTPKRRRWRATIRRSRGGILPMPFESVQHPVAIRANRNQVASEDTGPWFQE
jgi:hypothetical protein